MAAKTRGMANGTNKPGYMNSFVSFLESQDVDDPDDPASSPSGEEMEEVSIKKEIKKEDSSESFEEGITESEIKVEVSEEIATTDYTPDDLQATDGENTNSSEATSTSEGGGDHSKGGRRNVARRGKRKSGGAQETRPQRENLRRSSRRVKRYGNTEAESDGQADSEPEFHLSDSDDDPDFNPVDKKASDDEEEMPRRGKSRGRGGTPYRGIFSPQGRGRGVKRTLERDNSASVRKSTTTAAATTTTTTTTTTAATSTASSTTTTTTAASTTTTTTTTTATTTTTTSSTAPKRRGRPPSYQAVRILPVPSSGGDSGTESGGQGSTGVTNETRGPAQLSSAYNYAGGQGQRQTQNIMLPEAPQLTEEQLEMSGDFVMAKKDMDLMDNPPIWRIDGKSLLQKFQAFEKDGKILYRNISTYSGWTSQAKPLYLGVEVTFVFQSRYDTVVQMVGFKPEGEEEEEESDATKDDSNKQSWSSMKSQQNDFEISEELRSHMSSFEVYLQTLISQALDNNFLVEIYEENDEYFVGRVKVIDELAEQRKEKVLEIVKWNDRFKGSLDTWPCVNVMIRANKNLEMCAACSKIAAAKLLQLYGQPYNQQTLRYREALPSESDEKNFNVCESCSNISQLYNKVSHQKYDYYSQCKSKVTNLRVADSKKPTTNILQDLLANDHWITKLFRSMCTTWIKVDKLHEDEVERLKKSEQTAT